MTVNAVDCTGLSPSQISALSKNGVKTVGRYLSRSIWKGLTVGEVANLKAAGIQIFSIYETNPTKASYFSAATGRTDAEEAIAMAKVVGQPEGSSIYFTVDYDAQAADLKDILAYFQAVKASLSDSGYKVGAYGSFTVLNYLHQNNAADYWFQTVAWSNGQHCSFLNIYQFQCDKTLGGVSVDYDNLEQDDIGAWGQAVIKPAAQSAAKPVIKQIGVVTLTMHSVIRTGPNGSAPIVKTVEKGDAFKCYGTLNGWYNVGAGWVYSGCSTFKKL